MKSAKGSEMTFSNRIRIGNQKIYLDELPKDKQEHIANSFIYRPLATIPNITIEQTA